MKHILIALTILLFSSAANAQHAHTGAADAKPMSLMAGLGDVHHPVSTTNAEAQRFFDQGLALVYGFNHDEAVRSFKRAAELDPSLAMAHWGVAVALGPNINMPVDGEHEKAAYEAIQRARSLISKASEAERAYIEALTKRYSNDPKTDLKKLDVDYKNAMAEVARRFPDDLDAATLYAESIMDLRPWQFWSPDGTPAEGTLELVAVLESVLRRNPDHIGANHYYIHAVEASLHPEWALPSAQRLKVLAPAAGHLVHMPAHIDIRSGNYDAAARANAYAAEADREYFKTTGEQGMYPMMYYSHNLHFLAVANAMQGRYQDSKRAAEQLTANLSPNLKMSGPMLEALLPLLDAFLPTETLINVRFHRWDDVLKSPAPDRRLVINTSLWHFARAMANASTGKLDEAAKEHDAFMTAMKSLPTGAPYGFLNSASTVLGVADNIASAKIAMAKNDKRTAIERLKKALELEDSLNYDEPEDWYIPVRESLGGALMMNGDYAEAEKVFRAELKKHLRNGRALFGLLESLKAQNKKEAARFVEMEFQAAWKNADTKLRVEDL
ncbi:MAG TPA: tetratricopeptide repeat protein [Blastocatellia bacterium]